jgi:hypothetical protein
MGVRSHLIIADISEAEAIAASGGPAGVLLQGHRRHKALLPRFRVKLRCDSAIRHDIMERDEILGLVGRK